MHCAKEFVVSTAKYGGLLIVLCLTKYGIPTGAVICFVAELVVHCVVIEHDKPVRPTSLE